MKRMILKRITAGLCFAVLILGVGFGACVLASEKKLCDNVLRLHILANSDSDRDIAVKNELARRMKPLIEVMFSECADFEKALELAENNKKNLALSAKKMLEDMGYSEKITVTVSPWRYDSRVFEGKVYPSGEYCSVRIKIGEGKGHNWWCVLFSPFTDTGIEYDASQKDGCEVKLKFLDWFR